MKYLIFITLFSISFMGFGQNTPTESVTRLSMGFHLGVNSSRFQTEIDSTDVSARIGWQAGAMLRYGNRFFVQGKLNLGQSTVNMVTPDTALVNIESQLQRSFITIPVTLGYKIFQSPDGSSSFHLSGGIEAMAILKTQIDENLFYFTQDDFEPFSWAAVGYLGADLWVVRLDLGLHYGLTPMLQNDENSKNVMGTFNIGIIF
ncbi:MAG: PorT family protein [Bacteroidales bacterium]|nr:PorT family protein [Bacteroidales bacterium]